MNDQKPTHCYIGKKDCGCTVAVCIDGRNKSTADFVWDMIGKWNLIVERVKLGEFELVENCPHEERQLLLFGAD